jgi:ATP-dependent DNA helicase RecQ
LSYFGEVQKEDCGRSNNCLYPIEKFPAKDEILIALEAAIKTGEKFNIAHLVHVIRGDKTDYIMSYEHDKLNVFGKGKEREPSYWESIIRQTNVLGFLKKDIDNFGVLHITSDGLAYLTDPYPINLSKEHDYSKVSEDEDEDKEIGNNLQDRTHDSVLFEMLKSLRKIVAKQKGFPPFAIFQDPSLEEMATLYPTTEEDLAQINGVGAGKVQRYGKPFLEMIKNYVEENDIETARDVMVRTTVNKSKTKIWLIQQIDRKVDLEEAGETKNMTLSEVLDEIEHICYSGTRLNLDYYINQIMDEERQEEIYDYFMTADSDNLQIALDELGDEYSEEELRLMRIKFLSEVAN